MEKRHLAGLGKALGLAQGGMRFGIICLFYKRKRLSNYFLAAFFDFVASCFWSYLILFGIGLRSVKSAILMGLSDSMLFLAAIPINTDSTPSLIPADLA